MRKRFEDADQRAARELFAQMTRRQKIVYFWEYHRWMLIGGIVLLIAGASLIYTVRSNVMKEPALQVALANANAAAAEQSTVALDAADALASLQNGVVLDTSLQLQEQVSDGMQANAPMVLAARLASGEMDLLCLPRDLFEEICTSGAYLPLSQVFSDQELAELDAQEQRLVSAPDPDGGTQTIYGVNIHGSRLKEIYLYDETQDYVIGITSTGTRPQDAAAFLRWVFR